ncbi:MAG: glycosyltransferase [Myxococcota bacterium]|nr:glycosyltransferase [Myxococcota bacterium]
MSPKKVFLIGSGPLPMHNPKEMGFPSLRTRQFLLPILAAGHEVMLACLTPRECNSGPASSGEEPLELSVDTAAGWRNFRYTVVHPDEPGRFLSLRDLRGAFQPDVTVTAGPFLPMAAGARAAGEEPLWIDVPGDPMSEAQARAHRAGSSDPIHRYREMLGWALARGDRFSVISDAQRGPLVGALGLAGRMTGEALGHEWVHVIPGSVEGLTSEVAEGQLGTLPDSFPDLAEGSFVVLFSGGYNTWLDGDSMLDGLLRAMEEDPTIHFVSTGGALRGHDELSYDRFVEKARLSAHGDRFHFLGWVEADTLPGIYARSQLCLFVDLPCYEAEFGARTRVLEAMERGVPVAATDFCDMTHELSDTNMFHSLADSDPKTIATLLLELARTWRSHGSLALQGDGPGWRIARERYGIEATTQQLLTWLEAPGRSPGGVAIDFLEDYWQELARLQDRLEEVWNSPTWRYLGRLHKLFSRISRGS